MLLFKPAFAVGLILTAIGFIIFIDHREVVFFAEIIADCANPVIAPLVGLIAFTGLFIDVIEDDVVMNVAFIHVRGQYIFIFALEHFFAERKADFMRLFRRSFTRQKGLNQVPRQHISSRMSILSGAQKLHGCAGRQAIKSINQNFLIGLVRIGDIVDRVVWVALMGWIFVMAIGCLLLF